MLQAAIATTMLSTARCSYCSSVEHVLLPACDQCSDAYTPKPLALLLLLLLLLRTQTTT
jgi:hypothetical protein